MTSAAAIAREAWHRLAVLLGAFGLTLLCFLVLPLMKTIAKPPSTDLEYRGLETAELEPPPPPPEEEPEPEPEPEEQPPELSEQAEPLDLSQLELALNPGLGDGWTTGDFEVGKLATTNAASSEAESEGLFALADLDQKPRVLYQPSPVLDASARKKAPGTVYVLFVVDQRGKVESPVVQKSSDPVFDAPALSAVRQWKFEPGKRNGQAVRFRVRVPITFPQN